ncbi:MAG: aminoacyl-tRNA hydrolase [Rhizobiales bacterium]|nr:aminoacyl-tRNA hydrolase [Hyphomicrobiales bacterium]
MARIQITDDISLFDDEFEEKFIRSGGPGGQNVNSVATAVQLRFNVRRARSLPERVRSKILNSGDSRLTKDGELVLIAERHRTQEANRRDALERLKEIIRQASHVPRRRIATRPTLGSKKRRLEGKAKRGSIKKNRSGKIEMD